MEPHLTATECHLPHEITQVLSATQHKVNTPRLNHSQTGGYSIYLSWTDERLSWPRWLVTYRDGLPAHRRPPIQVL